MFKKGDVRQLLVLLKEYKAFGGLILSNSMTNIQKHQPKNMNQNGTQQT